jgi:hypothetical protein
MSQRITVKELNLNILHLNSISIARQLRKAILANDIIN